MIIMIALLAVLGCGGGGVSSCLPSDIKPTDIVSIQKIERKPGVFAIVKTTVADKLKAVGARCVKGKLRDKAGKEIYFYRMVGCWGNPPADSQEILDLQEHKLTELKKRYLVIEMTCNPSGEEIQ